MSDPHWTSPLLEEATSYYEALLRPVFAGRRFLHSGGVIVSLTESARMLSALGAERPFLLGDDIGTGTLPEPDEAEWRSMGVTGVDIVDQMRNGVEAMQHLPADIRGAVDAWDPDGSARWLSRIMLKELPEVAGRRKYALREPEWTALEDKTVVDAFWDAAGIQRAPSRLVPADPVPLRAAAEAMNRGHGTVWAADARQGYHGGAVALRRIRPGADDGDAVRFFAATSDRVRVMPFLEGVPASIHGIVFPESTAVFRPMEMVVLRPRSGDRFLYAGCSTWYDPREEDRDAMRGVARRVGETLRAMYGYRGPFTVDGVVTEEGFRPTELNPRLGAGVTTFARAIDRFPLLPLCWAVTEGESLEWRPELLERAVVEACDAVRGGGGWSVHPGRRDETTEHRLVLSEDAVREAAGEEPADAVLRAGPGPIGGFVRMDYEPGRRTPGAPAAPDVARVFAWTDEHLGTTFGPLEAAVNLRP